MNIIEIKLTDELPDDCKLVDIEKGVQALMSDGLVSAYQFDKKRFTQESAENWVKVKTEKHDPIEKSFTSGCKNFDDNTLSFEAVGSTDSVDRDGDILRASGWKLDNFKKNPVLLWGHDASSLPIGKAVNVHKEDGKLVFTAQFAPMSALGQQVYEMFKAGYLNAFSVRFDPIEWKEIPSDKDTMGGYDFTKLELLEISVVTIPANAEALVSRDFQNFVVKSMQMKNIGLIKDPTVKERILKGDTKTEEKEEYNCECIDCGHKMVSEKHCKDIECPECGGTMRREERPGPGQADFENTETKSGRVLSTKNRDIVKSAIEAIDNALPALKDLLEATEEPKAVADDELKQLRDDLDKLIKDDEVDEFLQTTKARLEDIEGGN